MQDREHVEAVIEIPRGSRNKYEIDHATGVVRLDRVLYSSVHYPTDYGFIPDTHADDGDPLDILVLVEEPTFPGCHVLARPIGVLRMRDDKGLDDKIIAVPVADPRFHQVSELVHVGPHWQREIETFFRTYKLLEERMTEIYGWDGHDMAWTIIDAARKAFTEMPDAAH
jgi:inorganic pyrophosphatase